MAITAISLMPENRVARRAKARAERNPAMRRYEYWVKP